MPQAKFIIAGVLVIGAIGSLMFLSVDQSMVYYYTVPEVLAAEADLQGRGVRMSGFVVAGSIERNDPKAQVRFETVDKDSGQSIPVVYRGIIPDTFKDNAEVVVEGNFDRSARVFKAETLLAKCPSKYQRNGEEGYAESPEESEGETARTATE